MWNFQFVKLAKETFHTYLQAQSEQFAILLQDLGETNTVNLRIEIEID